jgi:hypothetical protein
MALPSPPGQVFQVSPIGRPLLPTKGKEWRRALGAFRLILADSGAKDSKRGE